MGYLFEELWFAPQSRMTGIWTQPPAADSAGAAVATVHQIRLGQYQDGVVESDFLAAHVPYCVGGFHGVGPDGSPWTVIAQVCPADAGEVVGARNPYWPAMDAIERALHYNGEATVQFVRGWTIDELIESFGSRGVPESSVAGWATVKLVHGLLADCCLGDLSKIVRAASDGCAFPGIDHECHGDAFQDIFARWAAGLILPTAEEDEQPNESTAELVGYCWPPHLLEAASTKKLRRIARRAGWRKSKVADMSRGRLVALLAKPRPRRRPGSYRLMRLPMDPSSASED